MANSAARSATRAPGWSRRWRRKSFAGVLDEADDALDRAALFLTQRIRTPDIPGHEAMLPPALTTTS
ncbi:hypothetical protein [Streptomyces sp. NPDC001415]